MTGWRKIGHALLNDETPRRSARLHYILYFALGILLLSACASIGSPDGGPYDETPPRVLSSTPGNQATNARQKKIQILFDEYIKIENASEKVIVSPPQEEMANVRADGKRVKIDLFDSLKANTTYTIDFSDAIVDNNEGNPMGNYTFSFSTGEAIDTMEFAGYVLNAEDLEPIKGILVGLYTDTVDSAFTTRPFDRVARTNGSGYFVIKGVAPGRYRAFALQDMDGNFRFSQKSEAIAFDTAYYETSCKPDIRLDTVWRDTVAYDSIRAIGYTHFYPDNVVLRAFMEAGQARHLLKNTREPLDRLTFYFTAPSDSLPRINGINFKGDGGFICEPSAKGDTVTYWITDTALAYQDTLAMEFTYLDTDTLEQLVWKTDTLELVPKVTRAQQLKELNEKIEEWEKEQKKKMKKNKTMTPEKNPYLETFLTIDAKSAGSISPNQNPTFTFSEPLLADPDSTITHFKKKVDSLWVEMPYVFQPVEGKPRVFQLFAEWEEGKEYQFEIDSASIQGAMGHTNEPFRQNIKVKKADEFGALYIKVNLPDSNVVVQLLDGSGKPVAYQPANAEGRADFFYLKPADYYLRCFIDRNGDGVWTTGEYASGTHPEEVFYFPQPMKVKAQWEIEQEWDVRGIPLHQQKPGKLIKQKADKEKSVKNKNKERAAEMERQRKKRSSGSSE